MPSIYALVFAGVALHLGFFIHGEHHRNSAQIAGGFIFSPLAYSILKIYSTGQSTFEVLLDTLSSWVIVCLSLGVSVITYRLVFHPLRSFPGPVISKISDIFGAFSRLNKCDGHFQLDRLHSRYGSFVRIGPCEISTVNPDAVLKLYGPGNKCSKGPFYDSTYPQQSMHQTRDKTVHAQRRRVWDLGFNSKALQSYERRITAYNDQLLDKISREVNKPMNVTDWFNFYSFDVMADLAFGESFQMLATGKSHFLLDILRKGGEAIGIFSSVQWLFILLPLIPYLGEDFKKLSSWCKEQVELRKKRKPDVPDLMSYLLEYAEKNGETPFEEMMLAGDSRLIIIAGSDTTAATLTNIFYYLACDPEIVRKLREEQETIETLLQPELGMPFSALAKLDYLNGVINETLRLCPPVPSGLQRVTPPDGLTIGDTFLPAGISIRVPLYTLGRSEECFTNPLDFIPERWSSRPDLVKHRTAFAPFSLGTYACAGKQLALMETRSVVTSIVRKYDVKFAPGETGHGLMSKNKDNFTVLLPSLSLVFTPRGGIV